MSENAEYIEAKNEQAFLLGKEYELDQKIKSARVVRRCSGDTVTVGCKVGVNNGKMAAVFEIVGSDEADPLNGRISPDSPIGGALCGHRVGDKISVKTPAGMSEYVITKID
ncbi:MAG: Transcription elongation factor GreA [bacterium ADurb.Bin400]|nr:MAG: Transcription elongation factor GreA [bacterium ADurb.Bin400]